MVQRSRPLRLVLLPLWCRFWRWYLLSFIGAVMAEAAIRRRIIVARVGSYRWQLVCSNICILAAICGDFARRCYHHHGSVPAVRWLVGGLTAGDCI